MKSIGRDVVLTILVRFAIMAGGFLSSVITARCLSPAGRGEYFWVVTLAQMLAQFGNLGLPSSNTYFVARHRHWIGPLLSNSLLVSVLAGGVGSAVVVACLAWTGGSSAHLLWFAVALAPATLFYALGTNLLVGLHRIDAFNRFQLVSNFGVLACLGAAALVHGGPAAFLLASALGWGGASWLLLVALRKVAGGTLEASGEIMQAGFKYAAKAYVATLCGFVVIRSNVFLLHAMTSSETVGYFSVASQVTDVIAILPQSVALVLFPSLIVLNGNRAGLMIRSLAIVGTLLAVGCGIAAFAAEPFVRVVFGRGFADTVPVLRWMLPGAFFLGLTSILSQYLAAEGFPLSLVWLWIGSSVLSIGLGWALIPAMGGIGAAITLSATHLVTLVGVVCLTLARTSRTLHLKSFVFARQGALS